MKKITFISILVFALLLTVTGCGESKKSATISITIGGAIHISNVNEGATLNYDIGEEKYEFEVVEITDEEIKIKTNKEGITSEDVTLSNDNKFTVKKGNKVTLKYNKDNIVFSY